MSLLIFAAKSNEQYRAKIKSMKRPLTVIVPCKNERLNIVPCIESFWELASEILVADSGSTDETVELARCFEKVRVISAEYITSGDFKNWAIPQAKNSWVLLVDADERITPELAEEIEMVLSRVPSSMVTGSIATTFIWAIPCIGAMPEPITLFACSAVIRLIMLAQAITAKSRSLQVALVG